LELLVVIGIVAVLCSLAIPGLISWIPKHKLGNGARDVLSTIEGARMRAVRDRVSIGMEFLGDNVSYRVWVDDGGTGAGTADDAILNGDERIISDRELPAGIWWSNVGQARFRFDSQGFPLNPAGNPVGGSLELTNGRLVRYVNLTIAGNASISKESP
jgi:Tfp pilus assembly protein FimT